MNQLQQTKHIDKNSVNNLIEISLSGSIPLNIDPNKIYKCAMCNQYLDIKNESLIDHSMLCTGF